MERNKKAPSWYYDEPDTSAAEWFYIRAFFRLSTCKGVGMAVGPIPWTAIHEFADRRHMDDDLRQTFEDVMYGLDNAWTEWSDGEAKKKRKRAQLQATPPSVGRTKLPKPGGGVARGRVPS